MSPESFSPTSRIPVSLPSIFKGTISVALIASSSPSAVSKYAAISGFSWTSSFTSTRPVWFSHCTIRLSTRIATAPTRSPTVASSR